MDRRKFIGAAGIATAAVLTGKASARVATAAKAEPVRGRAELERGLWGDLEAVASQMLAQSGEMWLAARDRTDGKNPILISQGDRDCIEITRHGEQWCSARRRMARKERREVGANAALAIGSLNFFNGYADGEIHCYRTRAFVKNGRRSEWDISIEDVVIKGTTAVEITSRPVSPIEAERKTT